MRPLVVAVLALVLLVGCGGAEPSPRGGPSEPPPKVEGPAPDPPPPAWVETESGKHWLAYGSFCWEDGCADYIAPWDRDDVPVLAVPRGEIVRFHLPFEPRELVVEIFERPPRNPRSVTVEPRNPRSVTVEPKRVFEWRLELESYVGIGASKEGGGDASYLARFTFR